MPDKIIASYDPHTGAPIYTDGTRGEPQLTAEEPGAAAQAVSAPSAGQTAAAPEPTAEETAAKNAVIAPTELPAAEPSGDGKPAAQDADDCVPTMGTMLETLNILMPDLMGDDNNSTAFAAPDAAVASSAALTAKAFYDAKAEALETEPSTEASAAQAAPSQPAVSPYTAQPATQAPSPYAGARYASAPLYASQTGPRARTQREHIPTAPQPEGGDYAPSDCAGFFTRLAAFVLDSLIAWVMSLIVSSVVGLALGSLMDDYLFFSITVKSVVRWVVVALYFVLLTGFCGATLGKRLLRIQVVSPDGTKPSWWSVIYRETIGRYLSSLLLIGYFVLAFDKRHRGFHDMLADTRVVYCA